MRRRYELAEVVKDLNVVPAFGPALRDLRASRGMSLAQLSRLTHFSKGYLSRVENGHRAASDRLARCCDDALGSDGQLHGLVPELPAVRSGSVPPAHLPADLATFAGRSGPLAQLDAMLEAHRRTNAVMVAVITGAPGIGKSALAVHWAQRVARKFPDGQLFVNLRGSGQALPITSAEVMADFLDTFAVHPARIPVGLDARAARYRGLLAGKRVLLVLDDVLDSEQIRLLLPGSSGCCVVVTSRSQLIRLVAAVGARPLVLSPLTVDESHELLRRQIGPDRMAAEPHAVRELLAMCPHSPAKLALAAARAASNVRLPLADLVNELRETYGRPEAEWCIAASRRSYARGAPAVRSASMLAKPSTTASHRP